MLDLFCKAGGATRGYQRAGFYVIGVDHEPQPNYCGDEFVQADALTFPLDGFDAVHGSPPCQMWSSYRRSNPGRTDADYVNLIPATRARFQASGLPYVIENVPGAPLENPVMFCGTGFALDVQRHRNFETNWPLMSPGCAHGRHAARYTASTGRVPNSRRTVEIGVWRIPLSVQQAAMGIDWMTREELSQAIPPAYTEHVGAYLMAELRTRMVV